MTQETGEVLAETSWNNLVEAIRNAHTRLLSTGRPIPIRLFAFAEGVLLGHISPGRPARASSDVFAPSTALVRFASVVGADELVVTWEGPSWTSADEQTLGYPASDDGLGRYPDRRIGQLNIVRARPGSWRLHRYRYALEVLPELSECATFRYTPIWSADTVPVDDAPLVPHIAALVEVGYRPCQGGPQPERVARVTAELMAEGYRLHLVKR